MGLLGLPQGQERAKMRLSALQAAPSGHPPGSGAPLALEATAKLSGAEEDATCARRDGGQRAAVSGRHGVLTAKSAETRAAAAWRCARVLSMRVE